MKQLKHTNVCELKREFYSKGDKVPPTPAPRCNPQAPSCSRAQTTPQGRQCPRPRQLTGRSWRAVAA